MGLIGKLQSIAGMTEPDIRAELDETSEWGDLDHARVQVLIANASTLLNQAIEQKKGGGK